MISAVLSEALQVYRSLWRRSAVVAGLVFVVIALADALAARTNTVGTNLVSLLLALVGGLLVQGALVEFLRDLHDGRPAAPVGALFNRARGRLGTLFGASLLYGFGVVIGLVLLVVPGLIAIARWSLVVPLVMIEGLDARAAFGRSSQLVRGRTGQVLVLVIVANLIAAVAGEAITLAFGFLPQFAAIWVGGTIAGALTVPYEAYVLTVLYYRLTAGERAVPATPA